MSSRLDRLRSLLTENKLDALLVSQAENRRYLSGFTGSAGFLVISPDTAILATDFRYTEQAQSEAPGYRVTQIQGLPDKWLPPLLSDLAARKIGFESRDITFHAYKELCNAAGSVSHEIEFMPTEGLVESLRAVKDQAEIEAIRRACSLADAAFEEIPRVTKIGLTEKRIAWELESFLRENGSGALPFEIIVASGPRSAMPHARPADREIGPLDPVIIDLGAKVDGYACDMTRTYWMGKQDDTFRRIYDIVLGGQLTAMATLQAGMSGDEADQLARTVISQAGYGDNFGHGLGHGVGLATHEDPRLGPRSSDRVCDGMVFTIEPGIYLPEWGGVRIEDTVIMEQGKVVPITKAGKDPEVLR